MSIRRSLVLESSERLLIVPADNSWRYPHSARRKQVKLRARLIQGIRSRPSGARRSSLLTLTVDPNGRTPQSAYQAMKKAWNTLATLFRQKFPSMRFFRVVEVHGNGFPHIHVLLVGAPFIAQKWIAGVWRDLLGQDHGVVDIRAVKGEEHAVRYVTKYLLKQSERRTAVQAGDAQPDEREGWDGSRFIGEAAWWGARVRPWSASRGLLAPEAVKAPSWWDSLNVIPRVTAHHAAALANERGFLAYRWDDSIGVYEFVVPDGVCATFSTSDVAMGAVRNPGEPLA